MAAPRFITLLTGRKKLVATIAASAGAADAEKVPSTNASGVLDPSLLNAATGGANKVLLLDAAGKVDASVLPVGVGQDAATIHATEALSIGPVNIYNNAGAEAVRGADATAEGKEANGFVNAAVASGANATVFFEGRITGLSGLTPGARYYLGTTAGTVDATAPSAAGSVVQYIGTAVSSSTLDFEPSDPVTLA